MRKAFTLVELLIVVVVIVTLMTMTFRLSSLGDDQQRRNRTVDRIQRLENCLSGYYAAFGTYPPVRLHGSRNYKLETNSHGIQNLEGNEQDLKWNWFDSSKHKLKSGGEAKKDEREDWLKVWAACKAQPVDCRYPFPADDGSGNGWNDYVQAVSDELKQGLDEETGLTDEERKVFSAGFDDGVTQNIGRHGQSRNLSEWRDVQLFKFGLMSFLLPRYLIMMRSDSSLYRNYQQWLGNNTLPSDPLTGQKYNNWKALQDKAVSRTKTDTAHVANIPSQAVTARWMPNLEGICLCHSKVDKLFGIDINDSYYGSGIRISYNLEIYSPSGGGSGESTSGQYALDGVSVLDGWGNDFYYYSPAPYQSYVLWSAGANARTFPPWVSRESLNSQANECVGYWTEDDIVNLSH